MSTAWRWLLLLKFPTLDLAWPDDVQDAWWRAFRLLLAWEERG